MQRYELKEKTRHGNAMFPLCVYRLEVEAGAGMFESHWHIETEIIFVSRGKALFHVNGYPLEVSENQVIFINSGELHGGQSSSDKGCICHVIVFDMEMLSSATIDACQSNYINPLIYRQLSLPRIIDRNPPLEKDIASHALEIIEYFGAKPHGFELAVKSSLLGLISKLIMSESLKATDSRFASSEQARVERIKKVIQHIEDNYFRKIRVRELADIIKMSEYHFCRFFKSMTSRTPIEYINQYRINRASGLLLGSNKKILEVCLETGFENFSYFIKKFKEYKKYTPSEFRKTMAKFQ